MTNRSQPRSRDSEEDLRKSILENPDEGMKRLLADYGPLIRNFIVNFDLTREDREEVFQEVCHSLVKNDLKAIRVWQSERSSLSTYLSTITINTAITFVKSGFHRFSREMARDLEPDNPSFLGALTQPTRSASERLHRIQVSKAFDEILLQLVEDKAIREDDRLLLSLRLSGATYREIEAILGVSVETATSRISRLKPLLKRALEESGITPQDILDRS